jgi:3-oxoacyl-[acyl-carrier protein] reductase
MDVQDKTIVITGAARGLGQAIARRLARQGARLALVDLEQGQLEQTQSECRAAGAEVRCYGADVSADSQVMDLFARIAQDLGGVDVLINNAGTNRDALLVKQKDGEIRKMSLEDFDKVVAVDMTGVFLCAREAAAQMLAAATGGVIVNISSISRAGNIGQTNYAAAKAGVAAMTVTWAQELARHGIRVAGVAPGFCDTEMVRAMRPELIEKIVARVPLRRLGRPEEVAHAVNFILENDYYTGRMLELDGGLRF